MEGATVRPAGRAVADLEGVTMRATKLRLILAALFLSVAAPLAAQPVTFDLDSGTPALVTGGNLPVEQTAAGVTARFAAAPGSGSFSVQDRFSTGWVLSLFSGHYLLANGLGTNALDIAFSRPIRSVSLVFATADFQQVETPTTVMLTAFSTTSGAGEVGSVTAHGTYSGDTMPMGVISFDSAGPPFGMVEISVPFQPMGASVFLVDNVSVVPAPLNRPVRRRIPRVP